MILNKNYNTQLWRVTTPSSVVKFYFPGLNVVRLTFYTPVFRRVVLWYGDVRPGLRPGPRPSVTVFRGFLLHALTYWAEIWHVTFLSQTFDQVRISSISVKFCRNYAPFGTLNTGNTQFSAVFSYMLWHIALKFCIWLYFTVQQIKFECR